MSMSDSPERAKPTERGRQFFGAITASLSHEINNVLATVNELAGLLDDLCAAAEQGGTLNVERVRSAAQRISAQVDRGRRLVKRLNRFAHTVDSDQNTVETRERLEEMVALCQRFATLRRVSLEAELPDEAPVLSGSPFDVQHVVWRCIDTALGVSEQGDTVTLCLAESDGGVAVTVRASRPANSSVELSEKIFFLSKLLKALAGRLDVCQDPRLPFEIVASLPQKLRSLRNSMSEEN